MVAISSETTKAICLVRGLMQSSRKIYQSLLTNHRLPLASLAVCALSRVIESIAACKVMPSPIASLLVHLSLPLIVFTQDVLRLKPLSPCDLGNEPAGQRTSGCTTVSRRVAGAHTAGPALTTVGGVTVATRGACCFISGSHQ